METCLVSGGAGFIGSHLVRKLLENFNVICIDNISSGNENNIKDLLENPNFQFVKHNIREPLKIDKPVNYVFHLASRASPIDYQQYPIDTLLTNSLGTLNMLNLAKENQAKFLITSTSEVYGDPKEHPQKETYFGNVNCVGVRSCYDEGKRFSEALVMAYHRQYNMDTRIVRIFNTYGPRMRIDDGRVVPNFVMQALRSEPLTVYGDGSQTRSFCYIDDMVEGLCRMMFTENLNGEIVNLGNPSERTVLDAAKLIKEIINSESEINFKELPKDDPVKRKPDITKAKEKLGWEPKVPFEDGMRETIEWFKQFK